MLNLQEKRVMIIIFYLPNKTLSHWTAQYLDLWNTIGLTLAMIFNSITPERWSTNWTLHPAFPRSGWKHSHQWILWLDLDSVVCIPLNQMLFQFLTPPAQRAVNLLSKPLTYLASKAKILPGVCIHSWIEVFINQYQTGLLLHRLNDLKWDMRKGMTCKILNASPGLKYIIQLYRTPLLWPRSSHLSNQFSQ